jgi:TRAP-type C4-dicarboxylate transport system permease small subunit
VNRTAEAFGVFLLVVLTGLVFVNAAARYAFSHSFIWGDELVIAMIPWLAMAGLFLAIRRRNVIRIDFFLDKFPARLRRICRLFADLVSAAMFAYLGYVSIEYVRLFGGDQLTYLRWPTGIFSSSFVIGPLLAALAYLYASWRELRGGDAVADGKESAP